MTTTPAHQGLRGRDEIGLRKYNSIGLDLSGKYDGIVVNDYDTVTGKATVRVLPN
jgi:hypothetical protein